MALWLKQGTRWKRAHALAPYFPPAYVRLFPSRPPGPPWKAAGEIERCGADTLEEFIRALLFACRRPQGGTPHVLWQVEGEDLIPASEVTPFDSEAVCSSGVELTRLHRPPDRWLLTLHVARPAGSLIVASIERYLASWRTALEELLKACCG